MEPKPLTSRYLARVPKRARKANTDNDMKEATRQCVSAARSCINAAELVRDLVPPSHYLAICVHCLTLSGVALYAIPLIKVAFIGTH